MSTAARKRVVLLCLVGAAAVGVAFALRVELLSPKRRSPSANSIHVIVPYDHQGAWVFDDEAVGLKREPFVAGVPEMIDLLVKDIPDAKRGFRLYFSAHEFPGYQKKLTWNRTTGEGNYYRLDDPPLEGWICPALFRYYETAPQQLYVKAEPVRRES